MGPEMTDTCELSVRRATLAVVEDGLGFSKTGKGRREGPQVPGWAVVGAARWELAKQVLASATARGMETGAAEEGQVAARGAGQVCAKEASTTCRLELGPAWVPEPLRLLCTRISSVPTCPCRLGNGGREVIVLRLPLSGWWGSRECIVLTQRGSDKLLFAASGASGRGCLLALHPAAWGTR